MSRGHDSAGPGSAQWRIEEAAFLAEAGESPERWAERLDTTNEALARLLRVNGRRDLARPIQRLAMREERARQRARAELAVPKRCPCCGWPVAPSPERLAHLLRVGGVE